MTEQSAQTAEQQPTPPADPTPAVTPDDAAAARTEVREAEAERDALAQQLAAAQAALAVASIDGLELPGGRTLNPELKELLVTKLDPALIVDGDATAFHAAALELIVERPEFTDATAYYGAIGALNNAGGRIPHGTSAPTDFGAAVRQSLRKGR